MTGEGGCSGRDTIRVTVDEPVPVDLGRDTTICPICSITLDGGEGFTSWLWSTGATTQSITVREAGRYSVTVIDSNGCSSADSIDVALDEITGVGELVSTSGFSLRAWPNPFTSEVNIGLTLRRRASVRIEIHDPAGRKVATLLDGTLEQGEQVVRFDADGPGGNEGIYLLRVTVDGTTSNHGLVRKR